MQVNLKIAKADLGSQQISKVAHNKTIIGTPPSERSTEALAELLKALKK